MLEGVRYVQPEKTANRHKASRTTELLEKIDYNLSNWGIIRVIVNQARYRKQENQLMTTQNIKHTWISWLKNPVGRLKMRKAALRSKLAGPKEKCFYLKPRPNIHTWKHEEKDKRIGTDIQKIRCQCSKKGKGNQYKREIGNRYTQTSKYTF